MNTRLLAAVAATGITLAVLSTPAFAEQLGCTFNLDVENQMDEPAIRIKDVWYKLHKEGNWENLIITMPSRLTLNPGHRSNECKKNDSAKVGGTACSTSGSISVFKFAANCDHKVRWKFKYACSTEPVSMGGNVTFRDDYESVEIRAPGVRAGNKNDFESTVDAKIRNCTGKVEWDN